MAKWRYYANWTLWGQCDTFNGHGAKCTNNRKKNCHIIKEILCNTELYWEFIDSIARYKTQIWNENIFLDHRYWSSLSFHQLDQGKPQFLFPIPELNGFKCNGLIVFKQTLLMADASSNSFPSPTIVRGCIVRAKHTFRKNAIMDSIWLCLVSKWGTVRRQRLFIRFLDHSGSSIDPQFCSSRWLCIDGF